MKIPFRHYIALLKTYLQPQWRQASLLILFLLGSIALEIANPQLLGHFIDSIQSSSSVLVTIALLFIGLVVADQMFTAFGSYLSEDISWRATNALRADLALHCLNLDMSFHKAHTPGELIERVDGDVAALSAFFSQFVFYVLARLLLLICILAATFVADWRIGLLLLALALLLTGITRILQGIAVPHFRAMRQASADLASFFEERLSSIEDISSNGAQAYVMFRLNQLFRRIIRLSRLSAVTGRFFSGSIEISLGLATAVVLTVGAYLLRQGQMSLGTIYLTYYYTTLLTQSLMTITFQITKMQNATASLQRITELYHIPNAIIDGPGVSLPEGPLRVEFEHVSFSYTPDKPVLTDLSLTLQPGKVLGLLGRTGSGKTTLTCLLYRAYDVGQGAIRLGSVDVRQTRLSDLRARIGVVTQDVQLFHATMRDNLTFFDPGISDERLEQVLAELHLTPWYATLPDGLDTIIAGGGRALSSGEAQLLAFARVFLQNPDIVILDEASSRLDPATERLIEEAIARLLAGRTGIVIAHHLETVRHVDDILILEDGAVCEFGARHQLAADPASRFAQLLKTSLVEVIA